MIIGLLFFIAAVSLSRGLSLGATEDVTEPNKLKVLATEVYNGKNYTLYEQGDWLEGVIVCTDNHGLWLVSIEDEKKNEDIKHFINKVGITGHIWSLGTRSYFDGSKWTWGLGEEVKFFNWASGEPSNFDTNEKCIEFDETGKWYDSECHSKKYILCESIHTKYEV